MEAAVGHYAFFKSTGSDLPPPRIHSLVKASMGLAVLEPQPGTGDGGGEGLTRQ